MSTTGSSDVDGVERIDEVSDVTAGRRKNEKREGGLETDELGSIGVAGVTLVVESGAVCDLTMGGGIGLSMPMSFIVACKRSRSLRSSSSSSVTILASTAIHCSTLSSKRMCFRS